ncbi:hypothetical protein PR003_g26676 [Phytophthora rubi]|uniref:Uncharacterized protein n=1 Tax=Phytophthora rubi TaxID=129364 RepID=A0A6A4C7V3_9STRA|nr:hypothetical protein PR002_g26014 [Phytophthora rubi]KAE9285115.1 hypothetical protein PR003_g26676 [Phytophthora rubi]
MQPRYKGLVLYLNKGLEQGPKALVQVENTFLCQKITVIIG